MNYTWSDPETVLYYERFCRRHSRYRAANAELVRHAVLGCAMRVLDAAAGTGLTAEAALTLLGPRGRVVCFEPSPAMRTAGRARCGDPRVRWLAEWPALPRQFDRILIGAAIWQMLPLERTFLMAAALLKRGGALCFNIPSLYLGRPGDPGGGSDPLLLQLPRAVSSEGRTMAPPGAPLPSVERISQALRAAGFEPHEWSFRRRFSQAAYCDWLKIPVLTNFLMPELDARARARRLNAAFRRSDSKSWRWEQWSGWTAWK